MAKLVAKKKKTRRSNKQHWDIGESWIQKMHGSYLLIAILGKSKIKSGIRYKVATANLGEDFTEMRWPTIRSLSRIGVERLLKKSYSERRSRWYDDATTTVETYRADDRNWEQALTVVVKGGGPSNLLDSFLRKIERRAEQKKITAQRQYKSAEEQLVDIQQFREVVLGSISKGD